jgi:peroxiredoxin 1
VDSQYCHLAWIKTPRKEGGLGGCGFPLLADITKSASADYGVLCADGGDAGLAYRGLFIINREGVLVQQTVNIMPVGRSVDETLRLVQAFQFHDKHGEVCPANWKPGSATMNPDPEGACARGGLASLVVLTPCFLGSKSYFSKLEG